MEQSKSGGREEGFEEYHKKTTKFKNAWIKPYHAYCLGWLVCSKPSNTVSATP